MYARLHFGSAKAKEQLCKISEADHLASPTWREVSHHNRRWEKEDCTKRTYTFGTLDL